MDAGEGLGMPNAAGNGGVLRDEEGQWMLGYTLRTSCNTIEEAETWAIIKGLELAWDKGIRRMVVECDSQKVVNWINDLRGDSRGHGLMS